MKQNRKTLLLIQNEAKYKRIDVPVSPVVQEGEGPHIKVDLLSGKKQLFKLWINVEDRGALLRIAPSHIAPPNVTLTEIFPTTN